MMTLYSGATSPFSHRCRIVLYEKGMDFVITDVDIYNKPPEIIEMNPYAEVPILVDRDLVLYESNIINEYIDDRFPHPQLMPGEPTAKAKVRLFLYRFEREMFCFVKTLQTSKVKAELERARLALKKHLLLISDIFIKNKYFLGDEFSMIDIAIAPLLWRLETYSINLGKEASALLKYAERLFSRQAFIDSLTPSERAMRR